VTGRLRHLLGRPASVALVLLMLAGCLFLWVGVPVGWLWIGSQLQESTSIGTALMVTMVGSIVTIVLAVWLLAGLNRRHMALQEARNRPVGRYSALEVMLVTSAGIALIGFGIWFFGFAGTSPVPLNIGF
jgi:heme/copper-type cytochrome/quinol oxidase subunit 2